MDLSYREKSILGSLFTLVLAYGYYFTTTLRALSKGDADHGSLSRLMLAVIAIIVIETGFQIVLGVQSQPQPRDERDVVIDSKAYRNAYFFLYMGAGTAMTFALGLEIMHAATSTSITITPYLMLNSVLLLMVVAELVKFITQLFYYRAGVR